jgi:hypothetical protein
LQGIKIVHLVAGIATATGREYNGHLPGLPEPAFEVSFGGEVPGCPGLIPLQLEVLYMLDTQTLDDRLATLLAADTTTLNQAANALKVHLIVAPFVPGPQLDVTTLTEATFAGYAAVNVTLGAQTVYNDPVSGRRIIELVAPAGGWQFTATGAVSPAQTVYGYVLTDKNTLITYGGGLLPTPVVIQNTGDGVNLGAIGFSLQRFAMI